MTQRQARAEVDPRRQRTQYTCMSTSMAMALTAAGHATTEDEVNQVMGAQPMRGASWEQALACAQHYGCRATLTMPSTVRQLKAWTDVGTAVIIAWNPEGRDWSHASVVFHVSEGPIKAVADNETVVGEGPGLYVYVADPNIPNPEKTVRVMHEDEFYSRWYEKWPKYLVRRPACAIEREVTSSGKQVMAKKKRKKTQPVQPKKKDGPIRVPKPKGRNVHTEEQIRGNRPSGGRHGPTKKQRNRRQRRKPIERDAAVRVARRWLEARARVFKVDSSDPDFMVQYPELDVRTLKRMGMRFPLNGARPHVTFTADVHSVAQAERLAERAVKNYQQSHWPGGMGEVVGILHWDNTELNRQLAAEGEPPVEDTYVGVVNLYYSGS